MSTSAIKAPLSHEEGSSFTGGTLLEIQPSANRDILPDTHLVRQNLKRGLDKHGDLSKWQYYRTERGTYGIYKSGRPDMGNVCETRWELDAISISFMPEILSALMEATYRLEMCKIDMDEQNMDTQATKEVIIAARDILERRSQACYDCSMRIMAQLHGRSLMDDTV